MDQVPPNLFRWRQFFHTLVFIGVLSSITSCGFKPLYGEISGYDDGFVVQHLSTILVSPGDNRLNQIVYGNLLDRLTPNGPPELPKYKLIINLTESKRGVALERDATVSRFNLILDAEFALQDIKSEKIVFNGDLRAVAAYNILRSEFANVIAERNAQDRVSREIAEEMTTQISVYFRSLTTD